VTRLREKVLAMDDASVFLERTALCAEAWEEHQWEPHVLQTARIFEHVLSHMSVVIDEDDLLVGRAEQVVPSAEEECLLETHARFNQTLGQWTLAESCRRVFASVLSPRDIEVMSLYGTGPGGWRNGHMTPSWPTVIRMGFREIGERARRRLAEIQPDAVEDVGKVEFLESVRICADAIIALSRRYAEEAGRLAASTDDQTRRQELLGIRDRCQRVPEYPAQTFDEAVQAVWLVQFVLSTVIGARDFAPGRFDQYLLPLYERDLASGRLTEEGAQELVDCFFLKCNENIGRDRKRSLCVNSVQYLIVGGVTPAGEDAANSLSYMCLNAIEHVRVKQPTVVVRIHAGSPRSLLQRASEVLGLGTGNPSIYNDETMIPAVMSTGIPIEDARDYAVIGCANPNIPGKEGALNDHRLNIAKCLELALNNGICQVTGVDSGVHTGDPDEFGAFQDLFRAFSRHMDELIAQWVRRNDLFDRICATCTCDPFLSSIVEGCVESATDCYAGGATYFHTPYQAAGLATTADALAAIEALVYEEKALSLADLNEALRANFHGLEDLRQRLREKCPKFGNDDGRADGLAREAAQEFCRLVMKRPTRWGNGRGNWPGIYSFSQNHVHMGSVTAATADGRHAGEPISFNLCPSSGAARKGPTATANSVAKLDYEVVSGGGTFDLTLDPASLGDPTHLQALLGAYLEQGGMMAQVNVVDRDTLADAQAHPDQHRDLLVRVTGFSAPFTTLTREVQDEIIARHDDWPTQSASRLRVCAGHGARRPAGRRTTVRRKPIGK